MGNNRHKKESLTQNGKERKNRQTSIINIETNNRLQFENGMIQVAMIEK